MSTTALAVRAPDELSEPLEVPTFHGRRIRVDYAEEPVVDLGRRALAGYRLEPILAWAETGDLLSAAERASLLASDMERVDALTVERGMEFLAERPGEGASLILAMSFLTASSQRARGKLISSSSAIRAALTESVIWLLTDMPSGAPIGRVTEVVSLLRPFGRAIFAKTRPNEAIVKTARRAGIAGLILEPQRPFGGSVDAALWLLQAGKLAHRAAPTLIVSGLPSPEPFLMAQEAGFTHATLVGAAATARVG